MPSFTSLPLSLLEEILRYLCDHRVRVVRSSSRGTTGLLLPQLYHDPLYTLDYAEAANATLPETLLSPALASPVLAAAAKDLLYKRVRLLTYLNTEGRLPLWIRAFSRHLKAVSAGVVAEKWHLDLPHHLRALRMKTDCLGVVDMFKEIAVNYVQLRVLDIVHVPFEEYGTMQDELMSGLCATLESSHATLRILALPVHAKSDLCARALDTVTLPHLDLFTVELKNVRNSEDVSSERERRLGRPFLRMMQAVDGHADRSRGLTTVKELRLINMYGLPCTVFEESMCSAGLFRAVRVLRAAMNTSVELSSGAEQLEFFGLFRKLEYLHWNGFRYAYNWIDDLDFIIAFGNLCEKLRELHMCHREWVTDVQVGASKISEKVWITSESFEDLLKISCGKIMALSTLGDLDPVDFWKIPEWCPKLKHLLLHVTSQNLSELRGLVKKCEGLSCLEIVVAEGFERPERQSWQDLAKAVPRRHACLCDVAIRTQFGYPRFVVQVDAMIDCFEDVVRRLGFDARRLVLRAGTKSRRIVSLIDGVSRIFDACRYYAWYLSYLHIDLIPRIGRKSFDIHALVVAVNNLRRSKRRLVRESSSLEVLDLGSLHHYIKS